ncbi:hypothetical protein [[Clostridium] fimetarium]|uniref:Uncharacterized protein n=1 Tax=[Clostridium] fimetarium TaxID=99656 RepID=A0A1I0Q0L5_9FIRM|nr:hypothetical protein [[Clostridium] fimetarium]SEW20043.1 hypothetical protein SAMN05421659_106168 [[Clostridium] fimetarium]
MEYKFPDFSESIRNCVDQGHKVLEELARTISEIKLPIIDISVSEETSIGIQYLMIARKYKWPIFMERNLEFQKKIIAAEKEKDDIEKIIYEHFDDNCINEMFNAWKFSKCVNKFRMSIFEESKELYFNKKYYATTSIMMCQLYGVIIDINSFAKDNGIVISEDDKKFIALQCDIKPENINSEKGKLHQVAFIPDTGNLLWEAITEYFRKIILSSTESKEIWNHQPIRNKICHGDQLNFGTKEHALKSILGINLLIQLGEAVEYTIENNNDKEVHII